MYKCHSQILQSIFKIDHYVITNGQSISIITKLFTVFILTVTELTFIVTFDIDPVLLNEKLDVKLALTLCLDQGTYSQI